MASVRIPEETLHRLEAVARAMGRDADTLASEALAAFVEADADEAAAEHPHDWTDYLRYRFEEGRKAIARGEYFSGPPAELIARIRERVEAKHR